MDPSIYEVGPLQLLSLNADDGGNIDKKVHSVHIAHYRGSGFSFPACPMYKLWH